MFAGSAPAHLMANVLTTWRDRAEGGLAKELREELPLPGDDRGARVDQTSPT